MGGRWVWMGMVGLCSLASGCREQDSTDTARVPMQVRDSTGGGLLVPATPALAQGTPDGVRPQANAQIPEDTAPPPGATRVRGEQEDEPARTADQPPAYGGSGTAGASARGELYRDPRAPVRAGDAQGQQAPARAENEAAQAPAQGNNAQGGNAQAQAQGNNAQAQQQAPAQGNNAQAPATGGSGMPPARPPAEGAVGPTANGRPGTPAPDEGRVMIGAQAVQANDDEAWYEGAAKAAQAAVTDNTADRPLEQVVIASSTVSGKVTRVGRDTLHVRDAEGTVYELQLDPRSRGLRQGQRVPLQELREGTPVRAGFDLIGGRTVARDVQVRR